MTFLWKFYSFIAKDQQETLSFRQFLKSAVFQNTCDKSVDNLLTFGQNATLFCTTFDKSGHRFDDNSRKNPARIITNVILIFDWNVW